MGTMTMPDIDYTGIIANDIRDYGLNTPRSLQSRAGILGPSDLGWCRNSAALKTKGVPQSDDKSIWSAQVGTALHTYLGDVFKEKHPDWRLEQRITATFPSGVEISGNADVIAPDWNMLLDIKSKDGYDWEAKHGVSRANNYQTHTYALGALQSGLLDKDRPVLIGILYVDRSGREERPLLIVHEYDPTLIDEIDSWIEDVIYAVKTNEDAQRDIPAAVCNQICEFFTVCRGNLPVEEGQELITDADTKAAIRDMVESKRLTAEANKLSKAAKPRLYGINGTDGEWQVRWVTVGATMIEGYEREGYERLDVVRLKSPK
jgi:hypothetical protein